MFLIMWRILSAWDIEASTHLRSGRTSSMYEVYDSPGSWVCSPSFFFATSAQTVGAPQNLMKLAHERCLVRNVGLEVPKPSFCDIVEVERDVAQLLRIVPPVEVADQVVVLTSSPQRPAKIAGTCLRLLIGTMDCVGCIEAVVWELPSFTGLWMAGGGRQWPERSSSENMRKRFGNGKHLPPLMSCKIHTKSLREKETAYSTVK